MESLAYEPVFWLGNAVAIVDFLYNVYNAKSPLPYQVITRKNTHIETENRSETKLSNLFTT